MEKINERKALFFMPDISGFTQFINDRQIQHNDRIIAELLEILIASNRLNLRVNEIEGDAVLFYRPGPPPTLDEIIEQSKVMYIAFHRHLKKYGVSRICNCAACSTASRLTLKTVAHYGSLSIHRIQNREKLFGPDVIKIHRLLKNEVPEREYILITESIGNTAPAENVPPHPIVWSQGRASYDVGDIIFSYASLFPFYSMVPEPEIGPVTTFRSKSPLRFSIDINSSPDIVYDALIDLNQRVHWMAGLREIRVTSESQNHLNRICTSFECSLEHEKCTFQTSAVEFGEKSVRLSETFLEHPMTIDYKVEDTGGNTRVTLECHVAFALPMRWIFNMFKKKQFSADTLRSLSRLKSYCEQKK